jgi:probable rRNA maturation factor
LGYRDGELSVLLTDDEYISELNHQYLGREGPTNVLAFPMVGGPPPHVESGMMGDVVVSVDTALREARELQETLEETLYRLLIHGILHLLNYDHERSSEEAARMRKEEERLLSLIKE